MEDFRDELRVITKNTKWTNDEKFEAVNELHEKYIAKAVKSFDIPCVRQQRELLIAYNEFLEQPGNKIRDMEDSYYVDKFLGNL